MHYLLKSLPSYITCHFNMILIMCHFPIVCHLLFLSSFSQKSCASHLCVAKLTTIGFHLSLCNWFLLEDLFTLFEYQKNDLFLPCALDDIPLPTFLFI